MTPVKTLAVLAAVIANAPAYGRDFRSSDIYPVDAPTVRAVAYMDALIRQRTHGRHRIENLGQDDADSESFTIGQVSTGMIDMARINLAAFNLAVPSTVVLSLPYLFRSRAHMRRVLDGPIGTEILASLESQGIVGLCFYDMGARSFYSTKKPIVKASDLRGMKVRVQASDVSARLVRALGGTPVPMPFTRVRDALRSGVIDAADNNWPGYVASGHYRVAKLYSMSDHSMSPGVVVFSKTVWDQLSGDDRSAIRSAARDSVAYMRGQLATYEKTALQKAQAGGVEIVEDIDRKSFVNALRPLYSSLLPNASQRDLLKRIRANDEVADEP